MFFKYIYFLLKSLYFISKFLNQKWFFNNFPMSLWLFSLELILLSLYFSYLKNKAVEFVTHFLTWLFLLLLQFPRDAFPNSFEIIIKVLADVFFSSSCVLISSINDVFDTRKEYFRQFFIWNCDPFHKLVSFFYILLQ